MSSTENTPSRFVVGIDLGTTNIAVACVDTDQAARNVQTFPVPQLVAPGQVEAREQFPSFHYQPAPGEMAAGALRLPWNAQEPGYTVGLLARDHGLRVPGRQISSAKSWLSHTGVDRRADLLPWHGAADVDRLSPVEVSARYLKHIRDAWNNHFPHEPLEAQDVVITLPASFDEVARELTIEAARLAGLPRITLIEEPQAAFYAWINAHSDDWESRVQPGQTILVCDIGGGTSDFTLIRVRPGREEKVQFHRVAVGDHLILGGDNLDLALAQHVERKLKGEGRLEPRQWDVLVRSCRHVKETLLGEKPPEHVTINLPGTGARLLGGGLQLAVQRGEVQELLMEGFLPRVDLGEKPARRASGFQEFGLPYAADAAITRYLSAFLTAHRDVVADDKSNGEDDAPEHDPARPDIVLFNGGFFASPLLRGRLLDVLQSWFRTAAEPDWQPLVLRNDRLDLAVAHGAAYYGLVRRGEGVRIAAGLARSYYVGVGGAEPTAVCLLPAGIEPGDDVDLSSRQFDLLVSEPMELPLYVSSTRLTDRPGELVPVDPEQLRALPPVRTVLKTSRRDESGIVPVELHARLTEIGTLDLWCSEVEGTRRWKLQFDVRTATQTETAAHDALAETEGFLDEETWQACHERILATFGPQPTRKPEQLARQLTEVIGTHRQEWPASLLRRLWEALMEVEAGRRRSQAHEARWLNLLGFALRPGFGFAMDDWRVSETWKTLQGKLVHATPTCLAEWWILWRRIAGGLPAGQQRALATSLLATVRNLHRQATSGKGKGASMGTGNHEVSEAWRFLGALELLPVATKVEIGRIVLDLYPRRKFEAIRPALAWTLGRLGARVPIYGPLNGVVPAEVAAQWLEEFQRTAQGLSMDRLAVMQLARRTEDRYRDLPDESRNEAASWLKTWDAPAHFRELVLHGGTLEGEEQGLVFGEALPHGLRLR